MAFKIEKAECVMSGFVTGPGHERIDASVEWLIWVEGLSLCHVPYQLGVHMWSPLFSAIK